MSVLVLFEAPVKAKEISNIKSYLGELLPESLECDGCRGMDLYFNMEDKGNLVLVEHWGTHVRNMRNMLVGAQRLM